MRSRLTTLTMLGFLALATGGALALGGGGGLGLGSGNAGSAAKVQYSGPSPRCKAPYEFSSGTCKLYEPPTCPAGETWRGNGRCAPTPVSKRPHDSACGTGYTLESGKCVFTGCPTSAWELKGTKCVTLPAAPTPTCKPASKWKLSGNGLYCEPV